MHNLDVYSVVSNVLTIDEYTEMNVWQTVFSSTFILTLSIGLLNSSE
jgi:hypothetical protein